MLILPIIILLLELYMMKRWFPTIFNLQKRFAMWILKNIARWLWKSPERKGGASIRPQRMKWRP